MKRIDYTSRDEMMKTLADVIASELRAGLSARGKATLAVPGGSTPGPVFDALSLADLDWSNVAVMLGDERWVPETSERSNTALLRSRLLVNRAAEATLLPLYAPAERAEDKLDALSRGIEPHLPLTVCLMGMGADMHTASIFPGADRLADAFAPDAPVLLPMRAPGAPEPRITISARVIKAAAHRHIVITGAEKSEALAQAIEIDDPMIAPVSAVLENTTIHWAA